MSCAAVHTGRNMLHKSYKQQAELTNLVHFISHQEHSPSEHGKVTTYEITNMIKDMGWVKTPIRNSQT